jgi:phosphinothricin acetyltransferase
VTLVVRDATEADLPRISAIYDHAILHTVATADYVPWPNEKRQAWFREHAAGHLTPVVVADLDDRRVAGFAALSFYSQKPGFRFTRENTVYVDPACHRRGVGRALMGELIRRAREGGLHAILASIEAGNEASIALHASLGFVLIGREREVVFKFERWLDSVWMQLLLE